MKALMQSGIMGLFAFLFVPVATLQAGISFYHPDHLQSLQVVTDEQANPTLVLQFTPYGEEIQRVTTASTDSLYTGQELDRASELYYYGARYYDSILAHFIAVDPVQDNNNPSPYAYVANNPVLFVDPTGRVLGLGSEALNPEYNRTHKEFLFPAVTAALRGGPVGIPTTGQQYFGGSSGSTVLGDSPAQLDFALDITVDVANEIVRVRSQSGVDVSREVDVENSSGRARMEFDAAIDIEGRIIKNSAGEVVGFDWYKNEGFRVKAFVPGLNKIPGIGKSFQLPAVTWTRNFVVMAPDRKLYHMAETTGPIVKIPLKTVVNGRWGGTNPDPKFTEPKMAGGEEKQVKKMNEILRGYSYPNLIQYSE